jgi:glycosyltransferase involved in cell wall biosynthesis
MPRRVIVLTLGEIEREAAEGMVRRRFPEAELAWLERGTLRRRPFRGLLSKKVDGVVLIAADLNQPRLMVTSTVLGTIRASEKWRMDLRGQCEEFSLVEHLRRHGWQLLRHLAACGLVLALGYPILLAAGAILRPRRMRARQPNAVLYLRSQFWLGLQGGGSVAHTAGVIAGLQQIGTNVQVVSSDRLVAVEAPQRVVQPTMWFDGLLREAEELAYNVPFVLAAWRCTGDLIYQRHTAFNIAGAVLSRLKRVPLVLEFNSSEVWKGRHWGGLRLFGIAALVEQINLAAADRIVVVSRVLKEQLLKAGVPHEKVVVNPNGVDPRRFEAADGEATRARLGLPKDAVVIGFTGTFGVWHGIPTLAETIPKVLAKRPKVRFLLVGDGPLRGLIEPSVNVVMTGLVPHDEIPTYLAATDILLSPHGKQVDGGEFFGSPTKLFEYMAAGRAIAASSVGQIAEVLCDGETALLVPPEDAEALCQAIVRLVDDACLRQRLGEAAKQKAIHEHTWRQNAERLLVSLGAP